MPATGKVAAAVEPAGRRERRSQEAHTMGQVVAGDPRSFPAGGQAGSTVGSTASNRAGSPAANTVAAEPGFTLVELLVVIGIIGLLAALTTPVVLRTVSKARNAAIKSEIDMLHMALMNYKNEYGSFPPAIDSDPFAAASPSARHLQRIFPRCANIPLEIRRGRFPQITTSNAMVLWLSGFTDDPSQPLMGAGGRKKLYDFDQSRITSGEYHPSGKPGSPYIYIPSSQYVALPYSNSASSTPGAHLVPPRPLPAPMPANLNSLFATPPIVPTQEFANPETFQILCAGQDQQFGTDDDLSNFWPGTRREYLDSLKK
jgi:prepilin-type N-terminal cleavage/methylation domain-containing protein